MQRGNIGDRIVCPGCGQGWVVRVRVVSSRAVLHVCEECESTWLREVDVGKEQAIAFLDYMQSNGLEGLWSEVEKVD